MKTNKRNQGNLHQWWNNKTIERFKERANCFVGQYNKYEINGKHLNGKQTLGEFWWDFYALYTTGWPSVRSFAIHFNGNVSQMFG